MSAECCGTTSPTGSRGWLDWAAISMSLVCGVHCLVTPILLISLPILGRTFWVDENFHLWMLALVIPTTTLAVLSGCRRHKDRWVAICSVVGIFLLAAALWMEVAQLGGSGAAAAECAEGASCCEAPADLAEAGRVAISVTANELVNVLGGLFLVLGHFRNFRLCRKDDCSHED
ncbi:MerC domain-containing protein [Pelagicoccus mobilis]|uniref:MerC domain-containing protein n=1 Tax=Pelagicoccus mobilis TaxID=415221 RepID=A0A934S0V0_9BACT|nr:MerC domain-containing protein [Pelagicoccus mobilis]MBK1880292.1 MerC domain-containing protein [Pelagicoccus mobilis]